MNERSLYVKRKNKHYNNVPFSAFARRKVFTEFMYCGPHVCERRFLSHTTAVYPILSQIAKKINTANKTYSHLRHHFLLFFPITVFLHVLRAFRQFYLRIRNIIYTNKL